MKHQGRGVARSAEREGENGGMMRRRETSLAGVVTALVATLAFGCRRNESAPPPPPPAAEPEHKPERLVFPPQLRVADESVNVFVDRAMRTIAQGEYEPFRALWSVRRDPPSGADFDKGWQAVRSIRVLAIERVALATEADNQDSVGGNELCYALLAEINLDPKHPAARGEPIRDVVLVMIQEQGEWRLARAPKAMREWLLLRSGKSIPPLPDAATGTRGDETP